jgi:hypothetical protein
MIEIILLISGIIYAVRRPGLKRLASSDFPGVDPAKFAAWQAAELKGIDIFLWATWGAFVIKIGIQLVLAFVISQFGVEMNEGVAIGIIFAILIAWLIGLTVAGVYGSRAKKLRFAAGMSWPIRGGRVKGVCPKPDFSGLAVLGLVFAILGLVPCWGIIFASAGLILGLIACGIINRSKETIRGKGIAVAAAIVGGAVIVLQIFLIISMFSKYANIRERAKTSATLGSMGLIRSAIEMYKLDNGNCPRDLSILALYEFPKDAWDRNFVYKVKSTESYELFSLGPDGIEGTKDDIKLNDR